jgi:hypothetical protein
MESGDFVGGASEPGGIVSRDVDYERRNSRITEHVTPELREELGQARRDGPGPLTRALFGHLADGGWIGRTWIAALEAREHPDLALRRRLRPPRSVPARVPAGAPLACRDRRRDSRQ